MPDNDKLFRTIIITLLSIAGYILLMCRGEFMGHDRALRAARDAGFGDPRVIRQHGSFPSFYGCDGGDAAGFEISATNVRGSAVRLTVCCGLVIKSCTVRH